MFDQLHFVITYTTFFVVSMMFYSHISDIIESNGNMICVLKDDYMNLLHYCNNSSV